MINEDILNEIVTELVVNGLLSGFILIIIIGLFSFLVYKLWNLFSSFTRG